MPRLLWKGALNFGLVHAPVALYPATRRDDVDFDLLDRRTFEPVGYKRINKESGEDIDKDDVVKGYQYETGRYVILSDDEIREAGMRPDHTVDILGFVEAQEIPFLQFETPYYLEPGAGGEKVYALLREALGRTGKAGIVRIVIQTRQRLAALISYGPLLVLNTLRYASEVRPFDELNLPRVDPQAAGISDKELAIAMQLLDSMTEPWEPAKYRDTFRDDIMALVARKVREGKEHALLEPPPAFEEAAVVNPVDLTDVLRHSLHEKTLERPTPRGRRALHHRSRSAGAPHPRTPR
jgi:DNA end-binding protein Ku